MIDTSNEITVKIKGTIEEVKAYLKEQEFQEVGEVSLDDTYFIPITLETKNMQVREILSKAILVREIYRKNTQKISRRITFKEKNIDSKGNILNQKVTIAKYKT